MTCADVLAVKVGPGETNKGIYVRIKRDGPGQGEVRLLIAIEIRRLWVGISNHPPICPG